MWDFGGGRPLSGAGPFGEFTPTHPRDPTAGTGPRRQQWSLPRSPVEIEVSSADVGACPVGHAPRRVPRARCPILGANVGGMDRPSAFAHHRFIGDKRTQQVYDLDEVADEDAMAVVLDELMASDRFLCFGPDSLAEARNRGYRLRSV